MAVFTSCVIPDCAAGIPAGLAPVAWGDWPVIGKAGWLACAGGCALPTGGGGGEYEGFTSDDIRGALVAVVVAVEAVAVPVAIGKAVVGVVTPVVPGVVETTTTCAAGKVPGGEIATNDLSVLGSG